MTMPQDIKVLLVGDFPPPNGGIATHLDELRRAVRDQGARCEVLDIGKGQLPADGVIPAGGPLRFSGLLSSYAARGFRIHVHTGGDNPKSWMLAWACAVAGRLSGLEPILTLHSGLLPVWLSGSPASPRPGTRHRPPVREGHRRGGIPARGACSLRRARRRGLPAFTGRFLQPGSPPPGLRELRDSASPLYCAMAVTSRPVYGLQVLLCGFAEVRARKPRAVLAIYGPGTEELSGDGVRGFGELHRAQALALLAACDVFVRPTIADGDSVSVREALALGRAVVATSVGHRPEGVLLVPPGDAAALSGR